MQTLVVWPMGSIQAARTCRRCCPSQSHTIDGAEAEKQRVWVSEIRDVSDGSRRLGLDQMMSVDS